jgi:serine-type D-Ala-D-Ala carboxypeptidase/endopeptidase (penicillin-binding protein 4)
MIGRIASVIVLCTLLCPGSLLAQTSTSSPRQLSQVIDTLLDAPEFENAHWGVAVVDLASGRTLYERNARKSFMPASNAKLYTSAAALQLLGPDFRYETRLLMDGEIREGVLHGNLVVQGSGDPTIGGRFTGGDRTLLFRQWADSLRATGIHRIEGDIIGDDDVFDDVPLGMGWTWDNEPFWYSAQISGLSFNDAVIDLTIRGARPGAPAFVTWDPAMTGYVRIENRTVSVFAAQPHRASYGRARDENLFFVSSSVPEGTEIAYSLAVVNPTLFFVHELAEALRLSGISFSGRPVDIDDLAIRPQNESLRIVARHLSVPLTEIVEVINKPSQNLYAELVLKTLGTIGQTGEPGRPHAVRASASDGFRRAMPFFANAGIDTTRIALRDGSGLSRYNLVTPSMTVSLLSAMWHHPDAALRDAFIRSLPIAAVDGTLRSRMQHAATQGNVRAKTGTISHVTALSGYVHSASGTPLAFVIMNNHHTLPAAQVRRVEDLIATTLALYRR